jgi:hypothetical protein
MHSGAESTKQRCCEVQSKQRELTVEEAIVQRLVFSERPSFGHDR